MTVRSIGCSVLFAFSAFAASAQSLLLTKTDYAATTGARAIAVGDFNRDGWPDVAEVTSATNAVVILLSTPGTGTLTRAYSYPVGSGPFDVLTTDFNRDGILDLAVANADSNTISILLGTGTGAFSPSVTYGAHASPRGLAAGDWNRDGKIDLVVTAYDGGSVEVMSGNGMGGFVVNIPLVVVPKPQGAAVADVNGDGHLDIILASDSSSGLLVRYTGTSGFVAVAGDSYMNELAVGDLNGDGFADVAAISTSRGRVAIYRGSSSGLVYVGSYLVDSDPRGITIADMNADGRSDVITAHRNSSTVDVLLADPAHRGSFLPRVTFPGGSGSRAVAAADFDADGRMDLVTGNQYAATVSVLSNDTALLHAAYTFGTSTIAAGVSLQGRTYAMENRGLMTADFNRDGRVDFVQSVAGSSSVAVIIAGNATPRILTGAGSGHAVGDFNGDGKTDVVTMSGGQILTYIGGGGGSFGTPKAIASSSGGCVPGDMNRDGKLDLVCDGQVMLGDGTGLFTAGDSFTTPTGDRVLQLHVADMNRDGRLDVVGDGAIWYGDGHGHLSAPAMEPWYGAIQVGDVNHDGRPDVVFNDSDTSVAVALGASGGFAEPVWVYGQGLESSTDIVLADVNADGNPDIVINFFWFDADTAGVMNVIPGNGDGTFGPGAPFALEAGELVATDMTGDGLVDIAVARGSSIDVLVNQRNETNHLPNVTATDITVAYQACTTTPGSGITLSVTASDPDQHALWISWQGGEIWPRGLMGRLTSAVVCLDGPGVYHYQVTANDGRGGVVTRSFTVTVTAATEIYLHMNYGAALGVGWEYVNDGTAAEGFRLHSLNLGAPKVQAPLANPAGYVELTFRPDPTLPYKLWVRLKADNNYWGNDSIWVQFSGSTDTSGKPAYRIGTTSGLAVNLEECSGCGISGWGWEDDGWGAVNVNGILLRFPGGGTQTIRIQVREDGVSVDQVVLSADTYLTTRPGAAKNDTTILPATQ